MDNALLNQVVELCRRAGDAILEVYQRAEGMEIDTKADDSPVTAADLAAHAILEPGLKPLLDGVPVLSEEGQVPDFDTRSSWDRYWIIDPLDGTKEFIKRNGEFTVNVALIENGEPVLGVVYVPVLDITYTGVKGAGASKIENGQVSAIQTRSIAQAQADGGVAVVASRSHGADAVVELLDRIGGTLGQVQTKSMGSSLKLCLVAEGAADLYPRLALTCEWDTAAAQAVVEAAGGTVVNADSLDQLRYNQKDSLLNPFFYVIGDTDYDWRALLNTH